MAFLEIENLSAFYGKAKALHNVSFDVEEGGAIALIGANGAGKSTLLDSIMGLTKMTGDMRFDGLSLVGKSTANVVKLGIGYAPER